MRILVLKGILAKKSFLICLREHKRSFLLFFNGYYEYIQAIDKKNNRGAWVQLAHLIATNKKWKSYSFFLPYVFFTFALSFLLLLYPAASRYPLAVCLFLCRASLFYACLVSNFFLPVKYFISISAAIPFLFDCFDLASLLLKVAPLFCTFSPISYFNSFVAFFFCFNQIT